MLDILWSIAVGFVAGLIARALMPGDDEMGILATICLGVAGSFVGGFLARLLVSAPPGGFHVAGLVGSVFGALILLVALRLLRKPGRSV